MLEEIEMTSAERIRFQQERINRLIDIMESARMNQGVTDGFLIWVGTELMKIGNSLGSIGYSVENEEKKQSV